MKGSDAFLKFAGRLNRTEYAIVFASVIGGYVLLSVLARFLVAEAATLPLSSTHTVLLTASLTLLVWVSYAAFVKRYHDVGKSGWNCLVFFVPVIGQFVMVMLFFAPGTEGPNQYGPPKSYFSNPWL
jgi:uncharacterized membrane protein YhaH (DUF805 family)